MSGGEKGGGRPLEWTKSGENTSNSTSYSGSEPGSELDLPHAGAGPTSEGNTVGKKAEQGGGRAGDNREVSGRSQHAQQLKYYGRRNRAKQAVSAQVPEVNDIEVEVAGLVGCLAVDLTEQLGSRSDRTREHSLVKRNGSGGMASVKGTSRLERDGSSREVKMGSRVSEILKIEDGSGAVAAVDTGETVERLKPAGISVEDSRLLDKTGFTHLDYQENKRKNGIFNDRREEKNLERAVQSLEESVGVEASLTTANARPSDTEVDTVAVGKGFSERSSGKDSASSSSDFSTGNQSIPDGDLEYTSAQIFGNFEITSGKERVEEAGEEPSYSPPSSELRFPSNGEEDRNRKKGAGRSSARTRRVRGHSSKDGDEHSGMETSKDSEDQESSVLKGMPLEWRLALERRQYEESVLAKADDVWAKQEILEASKKVPSKGKEPARCKTHWDFVLEEMTWLAKDFERERKWKLSQAKKVAMRVSRSKLDVEAKGLRRQKEEEQKTRRVASNIAKDVKKFWMKVEKLVMYKHQLELEERRKKALDKHLDFLLGQTERYSTMLAENLGEISTPVVPKALPPVPFPNCPVSAGGELSPLGKEIIVKSNDFGSTRMSPVGENESHSLVSADPVEAKKSTGLESGYASREREEAVGKSDADGGDEDYNMDNDDEEEDDEATIAAEEALVTKEEQREELSVLQREQELPLEELMKLYWRSEDDSDLTNDSEEEDEDEDGGDHEQLRKEKDVAHIVGHTSSQQVDSGVISSSPEACVEAPVENGKIVAEGCEVMSDKVKVDTPVLTLSLHDSPSVAGTTAANVQAASKSSREGLPSKENISGLSSQTDLGVKKRKRNGDGSRGVLLGESKDSFADDREYIPAALIDGTDEDDETTLEEEEFLARAEADDHTDEIDRLKKESEMSIEELLAQYRSMVDEPDEDGDFEDVEDEYVEDRQDRTSEAGTSGSSEDDDDVGYKYLVEDSAEAKERMGEPSTSGREKWLLGSSDYGRKPKKKSIEIPDTNEESKGGRLGNRIVEVSEKAFRDEEQTSHMQVKVELAPQLGIAENGNLEKTLDPGGVSGVSLLLGVDEVVDEATAEALARVSAAAKRRGERILRRAQREEEPLTLSDSGEGNVGAETRDVISRADSHEVDIRSVEDTEKSENKVEDRNVDEGKTAREGSGKSSAADASELMASEPTETGEEKSSEDKLADAAAAAQSAQPTGYTFSTTKVRTKLPFLLKHSLREYQHIGLDWLVTMYEQRLNGILADEMGLGKTIMTISLLAHLACERGIWGPHLIVVPTSVMLNWETEFMKWCPAFKILTYFGSAKERKMKRQGWSKPNNIHVCITTYRLVIQDAKAFKRKKWKYLILDEAHLIKNWKSQRWQTLLNFNSKRRILLTGTPLQNDLMELWSLMHFLMPHVFQSHQEFRDWFSNPITGMVEGQEQINKEVVDRLHNVLRPFLLRRLKKDVEKQLPQKYEHVIHCRLSKRQRNLYEDFMASSDTQATLSSGNFLGLINVLMQLRKVCNHPDLFEGRPIVSSFDMVGLDLHLSSPVASALQTGPFFSVNLTELNLLVSQLDFEMTTWECEEASELCSSGTLIEELSSIGEDSWHSRQENEEKESESRGIIEEIQAVIRAQRARQKREKTRALIWLSMLRCTKNVLYGSDLRKCVSVESPIYDVHKIKADPRRYLEFSSMLADIVHLPLTRLQKSMDLVESFVFAIPAARAPTPVAWCSHPSSPSILSLPTMKRRLHDTISTSLEPLRPVFVRRQLFFPDRRLLQFDCGKLQELAVLLRRLKSEGHRALIFTQMTRMLDVLESFINLYGYTYMRLDGSTKPEQRQILMQRFNTNPKIFLFILSTRSGGVGINLVGADTVIFYDSDWNPAMDQQAQDRCHRIGQTREVHIYRLVSESTIEENILKKANQKRMLDDLVIQSGSYNTEFFKKLDPMELFSGLKGVKVDGGSKSAGLQASQGDGAPAVNPSEVSSADVEAALKNAEDEADYMAMKRVEQEEAAENQEFTEEGFVGNMEDEELVDDMEESKTVAAKNQSDGAPKEGVDNRLAITADDGPQIGTALISADAEEEMDMLADVKQMAAAAAASGRGSISFEDQLQPVERYAMRFLELWDPRVDKASEAAQVLFEEKEWELDQLEKLKEEQEAEIDEDNEPLFYESWDTAFANEAYRQQVEVLAQQQENQRQLEWEAMEEEMRDADRAVAEAASAVVGAENFKVKSKSLKKLKTTKFKSLKKGSLTSDDMVLMKRNINRDGSYSISQLEMSSLPSRSPSQRKRKAPKLLEEEMLTGVHTKKPKRDIAKERLSGGRAFLFERLSEYDQMGGGSDDGTRDSDVMPTLSKFPILISSKKKTEGKISIMAAPLKKGPLIMLEKERKKDTTRMQEHVPPADVWTAAEDAILCAVVHEYGGNWQLASDALAGIPDGSIYRGRHRHPLHCRERFRQLLSQNAATAGDASSEKNVLSTASNAHMKVTEEHTKRLLDVVLQLPDNELLLQRHFAAVLTAVRNKLARNQARTNEFGHGGRKAVVSPEGDDFILCSRLCHPLSSPYVTTVSRASAKMQLLVGEGLASADVDEDAMVGSACVIAPESDLLNEQDSAEMESKPDEEKDNTMDYLESDVSSYFLSAEGSDIHIVEHPSVSLSADDLLGYTPVTSSVRSHANAFLGFSEDTAEQRFRTAMNSGWGPGLYDWAAAASSGLGSASVPFKAKSKKRPPPADSTKASKPKQPRIPKVSKKLSADTSVPVVADVSVGGGTALHGDTDFASIPSQQSVNHGVSGSKETLSGGLPNGPLGENEAREVSVEKITSPKRNASAGGSSCKLGVLYDVLKIVISRTHL